MKTDRELLSQSSNKEVWKPVPGYKGIYEVSNLGRVKVVARTITNVIGVKQFRPEIIKKSHLNARWGYEQIPLIKNRKHKNFRVHRLVMLAFVGPSKLPVNHKNGIRTDNRLVNLEYCTPKENSRHAYRMGLFKSRLKISDIHKIRKSKETNVKLSRIYNVCETQISNIKRRKAWAHV